MDTRSHILGYSSRFWRGSTKQINYTHVPSISKRILLKFKTKQCFTAGKCFLIHIKTPANALNIRETHSLFLWQKVKSLLNKYTCFSLQERHLIQPLPHLRGSNISVCVGSEVFLRCSPGKRHRKKTLWPIPKNCISENIEDAIIGDGNLMGFGLQQNKCTISLSNSFKNISVTEKALFPNISFKPYIAVTSPHSYAHTPWT